MSLVARADSLFLSRALRVAALGLTLCFGACEPVQLPHEQPGPAGCGMRDPRSTAPGMLSVAQKEAFRLSGAPHEVRPNDVGGLDWLYRRSTGSVFGEEQTIEMMRFNKEGLLVGRDTELVRKVGK